jgi:hypothetical protein
MGRGGYIALLAIAFVAGAAGVWAIARDDGNDTPSPPSPEPESTSAPSSTRSTAPAPPDEFTNPAGARARRAVTRTVENYIDAIDARDGAAVCELVPTAGDLDLPVDEGSCAASLSASIGYRDPHGYPVFESASIAGRPKVELNGTEARARVTVVTQFADRAEPSVEDDLVYLERSGGAWAIAKPSSTLYRAIGTPDVPPQVLAPP